MTPAAPQLRVTAHRGGEPAELVGGGLRLRGEVAWVIEGTEPELRDIEAALPRGITQRFGSVLVVEFGNAVGKFSVPHLGCVEVYSGKWDEHAFEAMLADLTDRMASLPFSADDAAKLPYDRSLATHPDVLYQAFVYLRHVLSPAAPKEMRLLPALEAVVREPHARFVPESRRVPLSHASGVEPAYLARLASGTERLERAHGALANLPLARSLQGHLPVSVVETRTRRSHDTAENRFARNFLELAEGVIERVRDHAGATTTAGRRFRRVLEDCDAMSRALLPYRRAALWDEVGRMSYVPASSPVLQRRRGYREVYRHYVRLRATSRLPVGGTALDDLLELKDIAELYELWCYFAVVDGISAALVAKPVRADRFAHSLTHVGVPWEFQVEWRGGVRCFYNARFGRSRRGSRASTSVPLRPDIVLEVTDGPAKGLHVFDAKFRVQWLDGMGDSEETEGEDDGGEREERRGTFKRGDLYKMHAYRDALPAVRSVRVLYPGERAAFYGADGTASSDGVGVDGVGAVPLDPSVRDESLRRIIGAFVTADLSRQL